MGGCRGRDYSETESIIHEIQRYTGKESTVSGFTVEACNLIPKAYEVLMPHKASTGTIIVTSPANEEIKTEKCKGIV